MADGKKSTVPIRTQLREMHPRFWIANGSEAFERFAFFGVRAVVVIYMAGEFSVLELSNTEKGIILGIWAVVQCLLPMVSGGYTESYGYRKSLVVAFTLNFCGYLLMPNIVPLAGQSHALRFLLMLVAAVLVGAGTAIFKPAVQGAVAKGLNERNSSLGFGIFYWMVNIGGFFGPLIGMGLRGDPKVNPTWDYVFYSAAAMTVFNLVYCLVLFREPKRDPKAREKSPRQVFVDTISQLWNDKRLLRILLVISGFWLMFMQLWDTLPNFITEWVNTKDFGAILEKEPTGIVSWSKQIGLNLLNEDGSAKQEALIDIDAFTIILFVIPLSWVFGRFRMMFTLVVGMAISLVGFVMAGMGSTGNFVAFFIFVFAVGEILCGPKFNEYVGMTAPPDKKAQYMGYMNMPFAFGWAFGNFLSGPLYDVFSSKTVLARQYLVEQLGFSAEAVEQIGDKKIVSFLADKLGSVTSEEATKVLWEAYNPWVLWFFLGGVGLLSLIGMIIIYFKTPSSQDKKDDGKPESDETPESDGKLEPDGVGD